VGEGRRKPRQVTGDARYGTSANIVGHPRIRASAPYVPPSQAAADGDVRERTIRLRTRPRTPTAAGAVGLGAFPVPLPVHRNGASTSAPAAALPPARSGPSAPPQAGPAHRTHLTRRTGAGARRTRGRNRTPRPAPTATLGESLFAEATSATGLRRFRRADRLGSTPERGPWSFVGGQSLGKGVGWVGRWPVGLVGAWSVHRRRAATRRQAGDTTAPAATGGPGGRC
jgi:hypothetical protein